jgi:Ca-activated chloride channel homolog
MGQDSSVLAIAPISIVPVEATLSAPNDGITGSIAEVNWTGPNYSGDYIGICQSGKSDTIEYVYTSSGSPNQVKLPSIPGSYDIKYFLGQDSSVLASVSIQVLKD